MVRDYLVPGCNKISVERITVALYFRIKSKLTFFIYKRYRLANNSKKVHLIITELVNEAKFNFSELKVN